MNPPDDGEWSEGKRTPMNMVSPRPFLVDASVIAWDRVISELVGLAMGERVC